MASVLCLILSVNSTCIPDAKIEALGRTVAAVALVESGGDPNAVGDGGLAVGLLQIQPVMVADVNRILGREQFSLADRLDVGRSIRMFVIYSLHYWPAGGPEQWSRAWNGGPDGPGQDATLGYWRAVQQRLRPSLPTSAGRHWRLASLFLPLSGANVARLGAGPIWPIWASSVAAHMSTSCRRLTLPPAHALSWPC